MAIRTDAKENGFITPLGEKMIQDNGDGLFLPIYPPRSMRIVLGL